jgi:hypothetical protein
VVHDAAEAVARRDPASRLRRAAPILCALAIAAVTSGCGGGSGTQPQVDVGPNVGQPINLADCHDWQEANTEERLGTLKQLKDFASGPVVGNNASSPSGTGSVLSDQQGYDLLNNWCKNDFARGFKLYKLYERAAGFAGHPSQ